MRLLRPHLFPIFLTAIFLAAMATSFWPRTLLKPAYTPPVYNENEEWRAPDETALPFNEEGDKIRYGKELIAHTSFYFGPNGSIASLTNGMNCQNCHLNAGTVNFSNPFSAVASTYPKFRERSGQTESLEFRVNDCMQRSLNGQSIDSGSKEMQAMIAYMKWVGQGVPKTVKPAGAGIEDLPFLSRAGDTIKGKEIYVATCQRCHSSNGEGVWNTVQNEYTYPPLWGERSFNVSAGMFRLSRLAGFIKNNMPFGVTRSNPQLTTEQAWDVAAFIVSQPRSQKTFSDDWPNIKRKPVDHPFGPYADSLSEKQHKYGPFVSIKNKWSKKLIP